LLAIGNNLNQLTAVAHRREPIGLADELRQALAAVIDTVRVVERRMVRDRGMSETDGPAPTSVEKEPR
jgi:hypothetical protein